MFRQQWQFFFAMYPSKYWPAMSVWSERVQLLIKTEVYQASWQQDRKKEQCLNHEITQQEVLCMASFAKVLLPADI